MSRCIKTVRAALRDAAFVVALAGGPLVLPLAAQNALSTPQLSPRAQLSRTVGLTGIEVVYHAPSVRGREIFGGKVPFGVVWRAGANENTTISFSGDVTIEGQPLAAGRYGLHMIPGAERWDIIFNSESEGWGSYGYSADNDALRVTVKPAAASQRESLDYRFDDVGASGATLVLHWDETMVPIRIEVDVVAAVLAPVRAAARSDDDGPGWQFWFDAGDFGRNNNIDIAETMNWAERSIAVQRTFSNLWLHSELLADQGDLAAAGETRDAALALGDLNELQNLGHRYVLRGDLKNAVVVFEMVLSMGPGSWWPYDQLGQAKRSLGDAEGAIAAWRAALDKNPDAVTRSEIEANLANLGAG